MKFQKLRWLSEIKNKSLWQKKGQLMIHYVKGCGYNKVTGTELIKKAVAKIAVKFVLFNGRSCKELLQKMLILVIVILIMILMLNKTATIINIFKLIQIMVKTILVFTKNKMTVLILKSHWQKPTKENLRNMEIYNQYDCSVILITNLISQNHKKNCDHKLFRNHKSHYAERNRSKL